MPTGQGRLSLSAQWPSPEERGVFPLADVPRAFAFSAHSQTAPEGRK